MESHGLFLARSLWTYVRYRTLQGCRQNTVPALRGGLERERAIANTGTAVSWVHCLLALMGAGDRETRLCSRPDGSAVNGPR